ncbi:MAG: hypothetical protein AAGL17_17240, partial [Cyanobacteria bacterium J06576_12]
MKDRKPKRFTRAKLRRKRGHKAKSPRQLKNERHRNNRHDQRIHIGRRLCLKDRLAIQQAMDTAELANVNALVVSII